MNTGRDCKNTNNPNAMQKKNPQDKPSPKLGTSLYNNTVVQYFPQ